MKPISGSLLSLFFALWSLPVCGQSADDSASIMISGGRMFELQAFYATNQDSMSATMRHYAAAWLYSAFGNGRQACKAFNRLLKRHARALSPAVYARLVQELAHVLHRQGRNKQAAKVFRQYKNDIPPETDSITAIETRRYEELYQAYAAQPINLLKRHGDAHIPFRTDSVGTPGHASVAVIIPARLNGTPLEAFFDTGSSANILSASLARRLRLRLMAARIKIEGMSGVEARLGIADTLETGDIVLRNVPFYIVDTPETAATDSCGLDRLQFVLGAPWMQALGVLKIQMNRRTIVSPAVQPTLNAAPNLYYALSSRVLHTQVHHADYTFPVVPDFGASHSVLGRNFMEQHRDYVAENGRRARATYGGLGGIAEADAYELYKYDIRFEYLCHIFPAIDVFEQQTDNLLGMDFFSCFREVIFDLKNMHLSVY